MTHEQVRKFLNKKVRLTGKCNDVTEGILQSCETNNDGQQYCKHFKHKYRIRNNVFSLSWIKKIEEIK